MTVDVEVAAADGDPVLFDISYLDQYLLDIKGKFLSPVSCFADRLFNKMAIVKYI